MEEFYEHLLSNKTCPITGLGITVVLPQDGLYGVSYVIPDINSDCIIRISIRVLTNREIMGVLQRFKKQFAKNVLISLTKEITITTENYLAFTAQLSKN